jgi:DNA-binding NarL/FixJ family response regulator
MVKRVLVSGLSRWHHQTMPGTSVRRRTPGTIRVLIADDHRTFAEALQLVLRLERNIDVVEVVHGGEEAAEAAARHRPDVILMDVQMPGLDGITATRQIKERLPEARVVMLSAYEDDHVIARAVEAGAAGFLPKTRPIKDVAGSVRAAYQGEPLIPPQEVRRVLALLKKRREREATVRERLARLTPRETEILQRMAEGRSPDQIAEDLEISPNTLRTHVQNTLFKLGVHSKLEALAAAIRYGKVSAAGPTP